MATLSVLNYNNISPGLNIKVNSSNVSSITAGNAQNQNKTFNKITVQNVLSENSVNTLNITKGNPNAIVRKIKDFGMIGSVNNAAGAASLNMNPRKRPLVEHKQNLKPAENKLTPSASKKPKISKEERAAIRLAKKAAKENSNLVKASTTNQAMVLVQQTKIPGTPGRKGLPLPQAVARRNARERNRVKQVNNGFAALRERIPEEVAEVFENQGNNRGSGKKLSKVETLRMAVEYIRSLERLLGFDFPVGTAQHNSSSGEDSFSLIKDEFEAYSPNMDEQFDDSMSHYDNDEFFSPNTTNQQTQMPALSPHNPPLQQLDMLPNITTLNGLQYIRIPGTNTYQLLTPELFVGSASSPPSSTIDEEHFNALIDTNCISPSSSSPPAIMQHQHQQQTSTADLQSPSPPSINLSEAIGRVQETAPVLTATTVTNCENTNEGSATLLSSSSSSSTSTSLSLSPVPQNQQLQIIPLLNATSSPSSSPVLHQQQQHQQQLQALSPATTNDQHHQQQLHQGLTQACAVNQLQQQPQQEFLLTNSTDQQIGTMHLIKQEYEEPSSSNIYQQTSPSQQQQQQHHHLQLYHTAMSPPLERQTPTTSSAVTSNTANHMMQTFFAHGQNTSSFYENVVGLKKEFNEVLIGASHATNVMSDESMIEAIDWWDAHTPKSDGGSLMM